MPDPNRIGEGKTRLSASGLMMNPSPQPQYKMNPRELKRKQKLTQNETITHQAFDTPQEAGLKRLIFELGQRVLAGGAKMFGLDPERRGKGPTKSLQEMGEHAVEGFATISPLTRELPEAERKEGKTPEEMAEHFSAGAAAIRAKMRNTRRSR